MVGQIVMRDFMIHDGLEVCLPKPSHPVTVPTHTTVNVRTLIPPQNKFSLRLNPAGPS